MIEEAIVQQETSAPAPAAVTVTGTPWFSMIWVGALLLAAYAATLVNLVGSWFDGYANMEHGILVPPAVGYMVWLNRSHLQSIPSSPNRWGIVLVAWGLLQSILGMASQWIWVSRTAFLIALVGCIGSLYGTRMLRALAYPLCTMLLMVAPPTFIYERITLQLQLLASRLGEICLEALGYSVLREGNILEMVGERLAVAEACSGIKSLMALIFLAVVYGYFFVPQKSIRAILLISVIPIAIVCNAGRIIATGVVGQFNPELAHGMLHAAFGYVSLATGAMLCIGLHKLIVKLRA